LKLPVYNRAGPWRIAALVVLLSLAAVSTGATAREFRAAPVDGAENTWRYLATACHHNYPDYHTMTGQTGKREAAMTWCPE
jgi:hypothetical protein